MEIRDRVAREVGVPRKTVDDIVDLARVHVKKFAIPKRKGGYRDIYHPSKRTKMVQYWIIRNILENMEVHSRAFAYRKNVSILDNAKEHRRNRFLVKVDFKDFFQSICFDDFERYLDEWSLGRSGEEGLNEDDKFVIRKTCFYEKDCLAIGYPTSPIISNVVMRDFDTRMLSAFDELNFEEAVYTRYADDIIVSTDKKGVCGDILSVIKNVVSETKSPDLQINHKKTSLQSSGGGSASVTGLKVCGDGHITLHRKQKDHIRLLLGLYRKGQLGVGEQSSLIGHINYSKFVDPQFYSKLCKKYFLEIENLEKSRF